MAKNQKLDTIIDDLIEPVCHIANLKPSNDWPNDLKVLVAYARKVKDGFGFQVQTATRG